MSLKYRDSTGTETPVAGLNGTSGELVPSVALMQSGTKTSDTSSWVPGESGTFSVTLPTPMPDANYEVAVTTDTPRIGTSVRSKTTTGFQVAVMNVSDGVWGQAVTLTWTAFKLMTDEVHEADNAHIAQNTANFASAFSDSVSYAVGDYVTYNNVLYRCTTAHTAGVWVAGHFTQVTVGGELGEYTRHIRDVRVNTSTYAPKNMQISCPNGFARFFVSITNKNTGQIIGQAIGHVNSGAYYLLLNNNCLAHQGAGTFTLDAATSDTTIVTSIDIFEGNATFAWL